MMGEGVCVVESFSRLLTACVSPGALFPTGRRAQVHKLWKILSLAQSFIQGGLSVWQVSIFLSQ